jgi:hypothetical protein
MHTYIKTDIHASIQLPIYRCLPQVCRNAEQQESFVTLLLAASASLNANSTTATVDTKTTATNTTTMTASVPSTTTGVGAVGFSGEGKRKDGRALRRADVFVMTSSAVDLDSPIEPNDLNGDYDYNYTDACSE